MRGLLILIAVATVSYGLTDEEILQFTSKVHIESNTNLQGEVEVDEGRGDNLIITSNGIPDHETGVFPMKGENPNEIQQQSLTFRVPKNPEKAVTTTCLPQGPIAVSINGIPMFSPFTHLGYNAVDGDEAETFDQCDGHPTMDNIYHYHKLPNCILGENLSGLVGVALDGFPIYGPEEDDGTILTTKDLDPCHGKTNKNGEYRYHITDEYPYILGCFTGTPNGVKTGTDKCVYAWEDDDIWKACKNKPNGPKCQAYLALPRFSTE